MASTKVAEAGETVSRDEIRPEVVHVLEVVSRRQNITDGMTLWPGLRLPPLVRGALSFPFSAISAEYGGLGISTDASRGLKDVKEAVDLVYKRANRKLK
jgi:hypothetical protein